MIIFGEFYFHPTTGWKNLPQGSDCFSFEEYVAETSQQ
jgi:hypothetical protein